MMRTALSTFAALLFVAATSARPAEATTPHDNLTHFSFSQPVAIPGGVLPMPISLLRGAALSTAIAVEVARSSWRSRAMPSFSMVSPDGRAVGKG